MSKYTREIIKQAVSILNADIQVREILQRALIRKLLVGIDDEMICENCDYYEKFDNGSGGDDGWCSYFANKTTWQDFCSRFESKVKE